MPLRTYTGRLAKVPPTSMDAASAAAQNTAGSFERALRNMIEQQPYTAVAIALGVGWLLGRMHRPL